MAGIGRGEPGNVGVIPMAVPAATWNQPRDEGHQNNAPNAFRVMVSS